MADSAAPPIDLVALDDAGFDVLYRERIEPLFRAKEEPRREAVRFFWIAMAIGAPAAIAASAGVFALSRNPDWALFVAFAGLALTIGVAYQRLNAVGRNVKIGALGAIAEATGFSYSHDGFGPLPIDAFRSLRLLPSYDRMSFEDRFDGARHGCAVALHEAHLEERRRDSRGRTHWATVFQGQLVRIGFPKPFLGTTVVLRDGGLFNFAVGVKGLEHVRFPDPDFERRFQVLSDDQVEARYLVHPVFIERLLEIERLFKGKKARCAFVRGDLLVAIEGGNLFEPGNLFKPLADPARARTLIDELAALLRLADAVLTAEQAVLLARRSRDA